MNLFWIGFVLGCMVGFGVGVLLVLRVWTLDSRRLRAERAEARRKGWKTHEDG